MRRKRKLIYYVQDINEDGEYFWWYKRKWVGLRQGCSNMTEAKTFKIAIKKARSLKRLGGNPLITRRNLERNMWQEFYLK